MACVKHQRGDGLGGDGGAVEERRADARAPNLESHALFLEQLHAYLACTAAAAAAAAASKQVCAAFLVTQTTLAARYSIHSPLSPGLL